MRSLRSNASQEMLVPSYASQEKLPRYDSEESLVSYGSHGSPPQSYYERSDPDDDEKGIFAPGYKPEIIVRRPDQDLRGMSSIFHHWL